MTPLAKRLAPQDQTGLGNLLPDDPRWVWVPTYDSEEEWWEGSDYIGKPVPAFREIV